MTNDPKRDFARLLACARRAVAAPDCLAENERKALLDRLTIAQALVVGAQLPWPIDIHVGTIDHRHGKNHYAAFTRADLMMEIAVYCRASWSAIEDDRDPATLEDETVASIYFDSHDEEYLATDHIRVDAPSDLSTSNLLDIGSYCVLGTAHLSTSTANLLDRWCAEYARDRPLNVASSIYGWFVPTREVDTATCGQLPEDLLAAMRFGRERGFDHVLFDCDAGTTEGLAVHNW